MIATRSGGSGRVEHILNNSTRDKLQSISKVGGLEVKSPDPYVCSTEVQLDSARRKKKAANNAR